MAISSEGIKLFYKKGEAEYIELTNLQEVPDLSNGERETIEVTTLADSERKYIGGLYAGSEGIEFKFLYDKEQFLALDGYKESASWKIEITDGLTCIFDGTCSTKLDGVGIGAPMTYTLTVIPTSKLIFA
jgi:hypothetical protein